MSSSNRPAGGNRWDQNPVYQAAVHHPSAHPPPVTYEISRRSNWTPEDRTFVLPNQVDWTLNDLPDILKLEDPPPGWEHWAIHHVPRILRTSEGVPRLETWPEPNATARPLRNFPTLPERIWTGEPGWIIETWMRLDPTITYEDILMRMYIGNRPSAQDLRMRRAQARANLNLQFWEAEDTHEHDARYQLMLSQLPAGNVAANIDYIESKRGGRR